MGILIVKDKVGDKNRPSPDARAQREVRIQDLEQTIASCPARSGIAGQRIVSNFGFEVQVPVARLLTPVSSSGLFVPNFLLDNQTTHSIIFLNFSLLDGAPGETCTLGFTGFPKNLSISIRTSGFSFCRRPISRSWTS